MGKVNYKSFVGTGLVPVRKTFAKPMSGEISKTRANFLLEFGVPGGTGEPPARVPHGKTVRRTVSPPLLRFLVKKNFALCAGRPKALPLDCAAF